MRTTAPIQTVDNIDEQRVDKMWQKKKKERKINLKSEILVENKYKCQLADRVTVTYWELLYVNESSAVKRVKAHSVATCLDRELAPKDPALGPMGLPH